MAMKTRRPVHVGTRSWTDNEEGGKCIVAIPLVRGEVLSRVALDCFGVTRTAETNFDQPPIFSWIGGFMPYPVGRGTFTTSISTGILDAFILTLDTEQSATGAYLGGEPNPSGDTAFAGADYVGDLRITFRRNVIGDPVPVALDALGNADARFVDRFRTVINRDFEAKESGLWLFGGRSYRLDAQTDFGVAEIDGSTTAGVIAGALQDPAGAVSAGNPKIAELFHGGDNYIEADSFKETARRMYTIARPAVKMAQSYGRFY